MRYVAHSVWLALLVSGCAAGTVDGNAWGDAPADVPLSSSAIEPASGADGSGSLGDPTLAGMAGGAAPSPGVFGDEVDAMPAGDEFPTTGDLAGMAGAPAPTPDTTQPPPVTGGAATPVIPQVSGSCPAFTNGTISFMGLSGIQIVAGPKAATPSAPLVFYWHGTGGSSGEFAFQAGAVRDGVVAQGGVLVSFQNTLGGDLRSGTFIFGMPDYPIVDQLVACAVRDHNIDPRRIYTTGCSAGGLFSTALAAERSNYIAAAAPNSGGFIIPLAFESTFTPALMTIHGAPGVDVVAVDFSVTSKTADDAFKGAGGYVLNCNHGGGHCGGGSLAPDIWKFFEAHPYGVDPQPWTTPPAGFNSACKLY